MAHLDQFPMFRFATLLARQLSSPIANRLKTYARDHPLFGRAVCARVGRWYRAGELRFKMWSLQLAGPRTPISVSEKEAIDIGTDLLGEMIIFALGALIIIFEVNRQAMKQEVKKMDKKSRWVAIKVALEELKTELEIQQKEIDLLVAAIRSLDPDVPLPPLSTLTKPSPHTDPVTDPATGVPVPPSSSPMKLLPQPMPATDPATPSLLPPSTPILSPVKPAPQSPAAEPAATPDSSALPTTSTPDPSHPSPPVIHPPGCTCPPPSKPRCPPEPPPPTSCK